jgi:hypothetical protein
LLNNIRPTHFKGENELRLQGLLFVTKIPLQNQWWRQFTIDWIRNEKLWIIDKKLLIAIGLAIEFFWSFILLRSNFLVTNLVTIESVSITICIGGRLGVMIFFLVLLLTNGIDVSRHTSTCACRKMAMSYWF